MPNVALITGISGQDGSYLAEFLLARGYEVHGIIPAESAGHALPGVTVHHADLGVGDNLGRIFETVEPTEVYNLGAFSRVSMSFELPVHTANVTGLGVLRLLEVVREYDKRFGRSIRFYQASSSEMYGQVVESPQKETTAFHPRSPYACAKLFAHWQTVNYREAYKLFACNGILFNHESPRRGPHFVTRKITRGAARIKLGLQDRLVLGNLQARRDWGFAGDYVEAMWLMLQHDEPDDYVIATGETHSVEEFVAESFGALNLDWRDHVDIDPSLFRPAEVDEVCGDASKARRVLGWEPRVTFHEICRMMTDFDLERAQEEKHALESRTPQNTPRPTL
ncbi:MAG: GDP-mannose 4,6-dehydratase [Planctomycetaceae bacterium]